MAAEICPVCKGAGRFCSVPYRADGTGGPVEIKPDTVMPEGATVTVCHGCDGKGWVETGCAPNYPNWPYCPYHPWRPHPQGSYYTCTAFGTTVTSP